MTQAWINRMAAWPIVQNYRNMRERQLRYLAQSIQLEEAANPYLLQLSMIGICLFVLAFIVWATFAQIDEVTRAPGEVVPFGLLQAVQHLEGGRVEQVMAIEGQLIEEGQPILALSADGLKQDLARLQHKQSVLTFREARLKSFLDGKPLDAALIEALPEDERKRQAAFLDGMLQAKESERVVLEQQYKQKQQDVSMMEGKLRTLNERMKIQDNLYSRQKQLFDQGFLSNVKLLEAEEKLVLLKGSQSELSEQLRQAKTKMAEYRNRLGSQTATQRDDAFQQLEQVQAELEQNREQLAKLRQQVDALVVRAPVRGIIKGLTTNTVGGVIASGQVICEIVPLGESLVVEARIPPQSIGHLRVGQTVQVKVSAYEFSRYGSLGGTLSSLSATTFVGEDGSRYYKGRVALSRDHLGARTGEYPVFPGMTVMADVVTGQKTVLSYLLKPIHRALSTSFRER
ncbi:MAG: HlyD family type I secretion periplasmic adaptor subunit [Proteobacteria bacterium]|nr:HlyD family type I secretion periplasmic adaptor subunit [Pseudomonadota bacterium]